ncbi:MAG: Flp pilus assembly complex ATPase component TadA [Armatimonadetes bacterium]|nr:Flp pilus assembly complex ATPase component TadA [Armatimonadota bacterium]
MTNAPQTPPNVRPLAGVPIAHLLALGVRLKATNLHIAVGLPPVFRVRGKLLQAPFEPFDPATARQIVSDILTPEQKRTLELARDVQFTHQSEARLFRASVFYDLGAIAAAFTLFGAPPLTVEVLGLPSDLENVSRLTRGLILVTGANGSGKTSVVAALLDAINRGRSARIVTLEKRVEYLHTNRLSLFEQREIGDNPTDLSTALRGLAKQDADVIAVETMYDLQTMRAVLDLAQDRLVFAQIATVSAESTVERFIESFPTEEQDAVREQFANVLCVIVSCQLPPRGDGSGRVGAYEVLIRTPAIANLIREGLTSHIMSHLQTGLSIGMQSMENALLNLHRAGILSREITLAYSPNRSDMETRLVAL